MTELYRNLLRGVLALALLVAALPVSAGGPDELYRFSPPAAWVSSTVPDYAAPEPAGTTSNGAYFLLLDRQYNVTDTGDDYYSHYAARVSSEAAVSDEAQIDLDVDPTYQTIDIHFLRIVRDGHTVIDARPEARITALPVETQLQERVYNGSYNINILLADVRVGDVVEYAFTRHSREDLYRGHFSTSMGTGWKVPIHMHRIRIRAPRERPLHARMSNGSSAPAFQTHGNVQELVFEQRDVPIIPSEDGAPSWYSPWPYLQVSDFRDWNEVAQMTYAFYAPILARTPEISDIARAIKAKGGTPEQIALRALQYVQENVRYVSIAIGHGAFQPTRPARVVQRRYGDCKDKSVLLVSLLRELGIKAEPALVHSRRGHRLPDTLPTPFAFDHVIVRMEIDGKTYWADGTAVKQYATLSTDASPDFENALLISPASAALTPIPLPGSASRPKEIEVTLDLRAGIHKPGTLKVITRYRDGLADEMRPALASNSLEQRRADYLEYTARYYPSAKSAAPLDIRDDKERDVIEVHEKYTLETPFARNKENREELVLHPDELYRYAEAMSWSERHAPLALDYPVHVRQQLSVLLPDEWPIETGKTRIENPAFRYTSDVRYAKRTLQLVYEYEALKNEVSPAALRKYLADRKRFDDDLGYWLSQPTGEATPRKNSGLAGIPLLAIVLSLALGTFLAVRVLYRWDPPAPAIPADGRAGIGGWLIVAAIGVVISPLITAQVIYEWLPYVKQDVWDELPGTVPEFLKVTAQPAMLAIIGFAGLLAPAQVALAVAFFRKRTAVPLLFVAINGFAVWSSLYVTAWVNFARMNKDFGGRTLAQNVILGIAYAAAGSAYLFLSKRVKATFQQRYREPEPVPVPLTVS